MYEDEEEERRWQDYQEYYLDIDDDDYDAETITKDEPCAQCGAESAVLFFADFNDYVCHNCEQHYSADEWADYIARLELRDKVKDL